MTFEIGKDWDNAKIAYEFHLQWEHCPHSPKHEHKGCEHCNPCPGGCGQQWEECLCTLPSNCDKCIAELLDAFEKYRTHD